MRRFLAVWLAFVMVFALLAGCGKQAADNNTDDTPDNIKDAVSDSGTVDTPADSEESPIPATPSNVQKPADDTPVRTSTSDIQKLPASTDAIEPCIL